MKRKCILTLLLSLALSAPCFASPSTSVIEPNSIAGMADVGPVPVAPDAGSIAGMRDEEIIPLARGCCSHHGGVSGCSNGRVTCKDGTLSPSCRC